MDQVEYEQPVWTDAGPGVARVRERGQWFSPSRVIAFILGAALFATGAVVVWRCGIDNTPNTPLTTIFGFTHSASVGLVELVAGIVLMVCAGAEDLRPVIGVIGGLAVVGGILGLAATAEVQQQVGFSADTARLFIAWGAIAVVGAILPSSFRTRRSVAVREPDTRLHRF